uniref:Uncharacterized protein n=1 Tax=Anguilla anguilla TaxID=7936 RepID=A0A0E9TDQ7_ANGAN
MLQWLVLEISCKRVTNKARSAVVPARTIFEQLPYASEFVRNIKIA